MTADEHFQAALQARSLSFEVDEDGCYHVQVGELTATVDLENVRRNYERDGDAEAVKRFAEQLDVNPFASRPSWDEVRPLLRYLLTPPKRDVGPDDTLYEPVADELEKIFVYTSPDGSRLSWIAPSMLTEWGVDRSEVIAAADENMDQLFDAVELETLTSDGVSVGTFSLDDTHFKASLILSPRFKTLVSPSYGWPVYVVAPARDFVYILATDDSDLLSRLGGVVLKEFTASGHPVTADVLEASDTGITAIGTFQSRDE